MTPSPAIQLELARRELTGLIRQRDVAASSIQTFTDTLAEIGDLEALTDVALRSITRGVVALIQVRLLELQTAHENIVARAVELERAIKIRETNIVIPSPMGHG